MAQFGAKQFLEQLSCFWIRGKSIINYYETEHAEWMFVPELHKQCLSNFINYNNKRRFSVSFDYVIPGDGAAATAAVVTRPINISFAANKRT